MPLPKRRRAPKAEIIEYRQLKAAAGGGGSSGGSGGKTGYKAGQNVACIVVHQEKDGYSVVTEKDNLPGFIATAQIHQPGDQISAVVVCVHNGRILLSQLFSQSCLTAAEGTV